MDNLKEVEDAKMDIKNERKEREGWQSEVEELKEQVEVLLKEKEEDKVAYEKMEARVEIARAMAVEPTLLILDEPAAGLNPRESHQLNELLLSIKNDHATSILLIEHDMSVVFDLADRISVLVYGEIIACDTPEKVRESRAVQEAYLGAALEEEH